MTSCQWCTEIETPAHLSHENMAKSTYHWCNTWEFPGNDIFLRHQYDQVVSYLNIWEWQSLARNELLQSQLDSSPADDLWWTPIAGKAAHWIHLTMKHDAPQQMTVVPLCWICLGDESETVECLRRDCSCRGTDAGYVHQSCLVKYAEKKSEEMASRDPDNQDHYLFREPWEVCPNCHQDYQNDLAVDVSAKFVSFVQRKHPNDQPNLVDALNLKLWLLVSMINSSEQTLRIIWFIKWKQKHQTYRRGACNVKPSHTTNSVWLL